MLQEKINAREDEAVEGVEYVDDAEYAEVIENYVNDQEPELPEELMMEAEREKHEHKLAAARRCLVEDAHFLQGLFEDIDGGYIDRLDDPAEDGAALRRMADALDVLATEKQHVADDAPQPAPFPTLN